MTTPRESPASEEAPNRSLSAEVFTPDYSPLELPDTYESDAWLTIVAWTVLAGVSALALVLAWLGMGR